MEKKRSLGYFIGLLLSLVLVAMSQTAHGVERISYYHNDHLGSPVVATNPQGAVIWRESYQPYGTREHQGGNQNSLWFTGKQEEASFGVSYFGARWYDPEMGRFLAMDPVGISPGDPHSFNRYAYTNNNPYRFVDPDGKHPVAYGVIAIITTGGIVTIAALPSEARNEVARSLIRISKVLEEQKPYKPPLVGPVPAQDFDEIIYSSKLPPGFWSADDGSKEWGRRNGVGAKEGKRRFHNLKQQDKGKANDVYGVNPETGDVVNPQGEPVGNLEEVKAK